MELDHLVYSYVISDREWERDQSLHFTYDERDQSLQFTYDIQRKTFSFVLLGLGKMLAKKLIWKCKYMTEAGISEYKCVMWWLAKHMNNIIETHYSTFWKEII